MTRAASWLAFLYVILLPVGRSGLPLNAQWGDLLLVPLMVAAWRVRGPLDRWWRPGDWPLAAYLGVTFVAALLAPDPEIGLAHLAKQIYVACIFVVFRSLAGDLRHVGELQRVLVSAVAVVAVVSIGAVYLLPSGSAPLSLLGWAAGPMAFFGLVVRLRGAFEAPEFLGNALLVAFVVGLGLRAGNPGPRRPVFTAVLALLAGAEFLTFSHSVAGFFVASAFFVAPSILSRLHRGLCWGTAALVVLIVNLASVINPVRKDLTPESEVQRVSFDLLGTRVNAQLDHYVLLKRVSWSAFLEHPLTGIGPGHFIAETRRAYKERRITRWQVGYSPHSALLGRLAETGVVGGISLVLLWASWLRLRPGELAVMAPGRRAAYAVVLGLLVNSLNVDVMNFRFLWLALAWAWPPATQGLEGSGSASEQR